MYFFHLLFTFKKLCLTKHLYNIQSFSKHGKNHDKNLNIVKGRSNLLREISLKTLENDNMRIGEKIVTRQKLTN